MEYTKTFSPVILRLLNPMFEGNLQHDAHELLRCLLAYVQDAAVEVNKFRKRYGGLADEKPEPVSETKLPETDTKPLLHNGTNSVLNGNSEPETTSKLGEDQMVKVEPGTPDKVNGTIVPSVCITNNTDCKEFNEISQSVATNETSSNEDVSRSNNSCSEVNADEQVSSSVSVNVQCEPMFEVNDKDHAELKETEKENVPMEEGEVAIPIEEGTSNVKKIRGKKIIPSGRSRPWKRTLSQTESGSVINTRTRASSVSVTNGVHEPHEKRRRGRSLENVFVEAKNGKVPNPCVSLSRVSVPKRYGVSASVIHSGVGYGDGGSGKKQTTLGVVQDSQKLNGLPDGPCKTTPNGVGDNVKVVIEKDLALLKQPVKKSRRTLGVSRKPIIANTKNIDQFFTKIPQVVLKKTIDPILAVVPVAKKKVLPKEPERDLDEEPYSEMELLALECSSNSSQDSGTLEVSNDRASRGTPKKVSPIKPHTNVVVALESPLKESKEMVNGTPEKARGTPEKVTRKLALKDLATEETPCTNDEQILHKETEPLLNGIGGVARGEVHVEVRDAEMADDIKEPAEVKERTREGPAEIKKEKGEFHGVSNGDIKCDLDAIVKISETDIKKEVEDGDVKLEKSDNLSEEIRESIKCMVKVKTPVSDMIEQTFQVRVIHAFLFIRTFRLPHFE